MHTYCVLNTDHSVYLANDLKTLHDFATYNFDNFLSERKSKASDPSATKKPTHLLII